MGTLTYTSGYFVPWVKKSNKGIGAKIVGLGKRQKYNIRYTIYYTDVKDSFYF